MSKNILSVRNFCLLLGSQHAHLTYPEYRNGQNPGRCMRRDRPPKGPLMDKSITTRMEALTELLIMSTFFKLINSE
jgi:hypothetical protein